MPDVNFYVLASNSEQGRLNFACKLAEKAYRSGNHVFLLTENDLQKQKLDELLWTFRAGSFVPHQTYTDNLPGNENKVLISTANEIPKDWQQTIINLSDKCPEKTDYSERILEILDNDETVKNSGRQRYRHYQQSGFTINTYKM